MTFSDIGKVLGISQQRASAICQAAISKLRRKHTDQALEMAQIFVKPERNPGGNAYQRRKRERADSRRNKLAAV